MTMVLIIDDASTRRRKSFAGYDQRRTLRPRSGQATKDEIAIGRWSFVLGPLTSNQLQPSCTSRPTEPMQYQLEALGYMVAIAWDGYSGLGMTLIHKPDVIVLDIMLPGSDGWQVCQEIRKFSQVPIIMLTALGAEVDRSRGLELGAHDYLTKPFSFQELLAHFRTEPWSATLWAGGCILRCR
jgi:CheY-like chemotaxis protein